MRSFKQIEEKTMKSFKYALLAIAAATAMVLSASAQQPNTSNVQQMPALQPGAAQEEPASSTQAQERIPVEKLQIYVDGYHNYKKGANLPADKQHQMRVAHYCQSLSPDLIQCAVYDGNGKSAHLIGLEHIVSDSVFQGLPAGEKKYWHPHDGEVDSGMLDLPGMPDAQKQSLLKMIRSTHGKTWHVWDPGKDKVPMGQPSLMWAIAPDKMNAKTKKSMEQRKTDPNF
jgi:Ni/Co efflux regulator RcnB